MTLPDTADGEVDPQVLRADLAVGVSAFFTTRAGGVSAPPRDGLNLGAGVGDDPRAVATNRARVAAVLGAPVTWSRPVHGRDVARIGPDGRAVGAVGGDALAVDALVTTAPGRGVAALAADCVPVLLAAVVGEGDARAGRPLAVAAVHSGRRGLLAGVLPAAVEALRAAAGETSATAPSGVELRAVVGPAICGRCYEVPQEMRGEVGAVEPAAVATTSWGTPALDLPAGVLAQLGRAGVMATSVGVCTHEDERFYSYRRDGVTGRFAGVVATRRGGMPGGAATGG
ncbi:polyphenol oxidase family protein [Litorihabitans aurantiacus]|uniref:Laccase domain protein n=1 Tax=Litorihabitans aurantiacus TaxID=1930061 RepID=A0AA37XEN8_9MICO|nr:polyphenol oxidase family protein [Litorihabitans aurantiacus]GMA31712.1 laccase domain protein [Litorihabitans aurantiacus]